MASSSSIPESTMQDTAQGTSTLQQTPAINVPSPPQPSQPSIPKKKRKLVVRKLKIASKEEEDEDAAVHKALQLSEKLKYLLRF